jgi:hypothetical protein
MDVTGQLRQAFDTHDIAAWIHRIEHHRATYQRLFIVLRLKKLWRCR